VGQVPPKAQQPLVMGYKIMKMKHISILILACLLQVTKVYPQILDWITDAGTYSAERSESVAFDNYGNIYVIGQFCGNNISFDTIILNQTTPHIVDGDIFLVKYNNNGDVIWAKSFGGNHLDYGNKVFIDYIGNCIVTAFVNSTIIFSGSDTIATNVSPSENIMVKYSPDGNILWVRASDNNHSILDIQEDFNGDLYELGSFIVDSLVLDTITLYHVGSSVSYDLYIAKYDINGQIINAQIIGRDFSAFFSLSYNSDIFIIGRIYSTPVIINDSLLLNTNYNSWDFFIAKYSTSGNFQWLKKFGGEGSDYVNCAKTDNFGNIYIAGRFNSDSLIFDQCFLLNQSDSNISYNNLYFDSFIAKFDPSGSLLWAKSYGSLYDDNIASLSIDSLNNCFITGTYRSPSISFDSYILTNSMSYPYGSTNSFVVKLHDTGVVEWAEKIYSINCNSQSISTYNKQICLTGHYWDIFYYDSSPQALITAQGSGDVFVCKIIDTLITTNLYSSILYNQNILNVYPNPAKDELIIESHQISTIDILNIQGQIVIQQKLQQGKTDIDVSGLAKGLYILRLSSNDRTEVTRFVKV